MRKTRPLCRGRGKDGDIKEKTQKLPRTVLLPVTKLEWVEEEPSFHPNSGAQLGLQFVTETGVARPHGSFRDLIRSKARQKGPNLNGKLEPPRQNSRSRSTSNADSGSERSSTTTPNPSGRNTPKTPKSPLSYDLGSCLVDPFYTLPISHLGGTQFLIHHYFSIFKIAHAPVFKKEDLFNFAMTDAASLHSLLVHSALNLRSRGTASPDADMLYHQGESIRLINDRLVDPCQRVATDATIFTVCNMTHLEILSGVLGGIKIHMDGLEALVHGRGGIQGLDSHPLTRKIALWTDTVASVALETAPRFQLSSCSTFNPMPRPSPYSPIALRYLSRLSNLTGFHTLTEETISAYRDLHALTSLKDKICFSAFTTATDFENCAHLIEHLERRCLYIIQSPSILLSSPDLAVFSLFANAALIHIMIFMRESPRRLPFASILSNRIRTSLQDVDLNIFQVNYPEIFLWILIMGGLGGAGTENQSWFASLLGEAATGSGSVTFDDVKGVVGDWLWSGLYADVVGEGFWAEFEGWSGREDEKMLESGEC